MEIITATVGDVVVLRLKGELRSRDDISTEFKSFLNTGTSKFVFNFEHVKAINSIGLSTLLEFKHLAESSGGSIILCRICDEVMKVMDVTRLTEVFLIYGDEEEALTGFIKGLPLISSTSSISRHRN